MSAKEAFLLEKEVIDIIGRGDLNKGPLVNLIDGGQGPQNCSDETRSKISKAIKGRKHTEESIQKMRDAKKGKGYSAWNKGVPCSEAMKQKLRQQRLTEEQKEHLRQVNLGKKKSKETMKRLRSIWDSLEYKNHQSEVLKKYHKNKTMKRRSR
jgi:hypothetical protein